MSNEVPSDEICDIAEEPFKTKGKIFAYVPSHDTVARGWLLSIVVDGEIGHYPQQFRFAYGSEKDMNEVANQLNRYRLKLSIETEAHLIAQSMRSLRSDRADRRRRQA